MTVIRRQTLSAGAGRPIAAALVQATLPGAVAAFGHSPERMSFMPERGGQRILRLADRAVHHVFSLARPGRDLRHDADKTAATAAATRRRLLGMAAADRFAVIGCHLPFPGTGFVESRGDGFHIVPARYQFP